MPIIISRLKTVSNRNHDLNGHESESASETFCDVKHVNNNDLLQTSPNSECAFSDANSSSQPINVCLSVQPAPIDREPTALCSLKSARHSSILATFDPLHGTSVKSRAKLSRLARKDLYHHGAVVVNNELGDVSRQENASSVTRKKSEKSSKLNLTCKSSVTRQNREAVTSFLFNPYLKHMKGSKSEAYQNSTDDDDDDNDDDADDDEKSHTLPDKRGMSSKMKSDSLSRNFVLRSRNSAFRSGNSTFSSKNSIFCSGNPTFSLRNSTFGSRNSASLNNSAFCSRNPTFSTKNSAFSSRNPAFSSRNPAFSLKTSNLNSKKCLVSDKRTPCPSYLPVKYCLHGSTHQRNHAKQATMQQSAQHDTTQQSAQHNTTQQSAQHNTTQQSAQHDTTQQYAQHNTTQQSAQHNTTQQSAAQHKPGLNVRMSFKERRAVAKLRQRQEIYALNKVMTEFENKSFLLHGGGSSSDPISCFLLHGGHSS